MRARIQPELFVAILFLLGKEPYGVGRMRTVMHKDEDGTLFTFRARILITAKPKRCRLRVYNYHCRCDVRRET